MIIELGNPTQTQFLSICRQRNELLVITLKKIQNQYHTEDVFGTDVPITRAIDSDLASCNLYKVRNQISMKGEKRLTAKRKALPKQWVQSSSNKYFLSLKKGHVVMSWH